MDYNVVWLVSIIVCYESFVSNFWFRFCLTRSKKLRERKKEERQSNREMVTYPTSTVIQMFNT